MEDYFEEYFGEDFRISRAGHPNGDFVVKKGQTVRVGELLQEQGREYGTTTGRRRRCGWLDIPLVKYSAMVNGFQSISITKLDVLTGLKQLRIAVAYRNSELTEV